MRQIGRTVFGVDDFAGFSERDFDIAIIALAAVDEALR
jgi:hypothetical protein